MQRSATLTAEKIRLPRLLIGHPYIHLLFAALERYQMPRKKGVKITYDLLAESHAAFLGVVWFWHI